MSARHRSAAAAYVRGHDRGWQVERMRDGKAEETEIEWSPTPGTPRFGVGVARSLEFHRGPGKLRGETDTRGISSDA